MRRLLFLLLLGLVHTLTAYPEPFVDVMRARHDGYFYDQQAIDWQAEALGECSTEDAWWHYCKTAHYSNRFGTGEYDVAALVAEAGPHLDPAGFVFNYLQFAFVDQGTQKWTSLLKAHEAAPERAEAYPGMVAYYEIEGELVKRNELLQDMHLLEPIPAGVVDYNYNQLAGIPRNGLLLTSGDADTYPSWLLQSQYAVRQDLEVVNWNLLQGFSQYRSLVFERLGLESHPILLKEELKPEELLNVLQEQERPLLLAATTEYLFSELNTDQLYSIGLAFQYSQEPVTNLQLIQENFNHNWRLDRLLQPLSDGPGQRVADELNQNYLPALIELHEHYVKIQHPATPFLRETALGVARRADLEAAVIAYLDPMDQDLVQLASPNPGLKARQIDKNYLFIPAGTLERNGSTSIRGFHMAATEVSNADYQLFLEDLLRLRRFDYIDTASISTVAWKSLLPDSLSDLSDQELGERGHPTSHDHPVLNISHRAAELYALWLSQVYNQDPRRRDGRRVQFRLPSHEEWMYAASGGRNMTPYPWGGPYYRNAKGCYLANFNTTLPQEVPQVYLDQFTERAPKTPLEDCNDGGWLTVPVDAYFPNDYGLYQMSGNAAEMLNIEGETAGGSWLDPAYLMQIGVMEERQLPNPSTGFRLVMEYVD